MMRELKRWLVLGLAAVLVLAACGNGGDGDGDDGASQDGDDRSSELAVVPASFDVAVGAPSRFLVGVLTADQREVGFGTVELSFSFLGEEKATGSPEPGPSATAAYLALPGTKPPSPLPDEPTIVRPSQSRGVYAAEVGFDRAGIWEVTVTAVLDGQRQRSKAAFQVKPKHTVPYVGDPAIASETLTVASEGVPPAAIDSRANDEAPVPDPELHQTTIAEAVRAGRPAVVVFATPTFCVSRFCGPVTDMVAELAADYADRAAFVHVEIWKDFEAKKLNDAAVEWLTQGGEGNEPWVFLIGPDGKIAARWDNVATRGEIEPLLQKL